MKEKIGQLKEKINQMVLAAKDERELNEIKSFVFGKNGEMTQLLKGMKDLSDAERPAMGKIINDAREFIEGLFKNASELLHKKEIEKILSQEAIDITIDKPYIRTGVLHPINVIKNRMVDFFIRLGYSVYDSPEIETDYYNFQALNIPLDHPSRDTQDTFFITNNYLLRTQTSAGQIHTMERQKPPIKMISPGRTYRVDDDATHSPVFHQIEGLVVDKNVTMCDLKGTLESFAKEFFGADTKTRFRPSYFPFTEPSVEVDASCSNCKGTGCKVCKGTGWIEILGAGMVNRNVLKNCNIDPDVYTGFAFGMGLDRITMIMYGINDLKVMWENDIRFLKQFNVK